MFPIFKKIRPKDLKRYYLAGEPVLLCPKGCFNPNHHGHERCLIWQWDGETYYRDFQEQWPTLQTAVAKSPYTFSRLLAIQEWRDAKMSDDYSEPAFWVKDYETMKRAEGYYRTRQNADQG